MNRAFLYGTIVFAVALFITKPWDSGESAKAKMISEIDQGMVSLGVPATTRECVTDGFEREFTEADAELATKISDGEVSPQETMYDPATGVMTLKMAKIMSGCPGAVESVRQAASAALAGYTGY